MAKVQCSLVRFIVAALVSPMLGDMAFAAPHRLKGDEERLSAIRPEADGSLRLEPTFVCCSLEFGARKAIPGLKVERRKRGPKGAAWNAVDGKYVVHFPRTMIAPGMEFGDMICPFDFKAGRHTLGISAKWGEFRYDGIVLTDSPGSFEPR